HLAECTDCAERERNLRQLREAIAAAPLYHRAPDSLRARVQSAAMPAVLPTRRRRRMYPLVGAGIAVALTVLILPAVALMRPPAPAEHRVTDGVPASHVRSLQVDHLTDVASSDRHTVKPWFRGKLDFSPPVPDLAADGFPLTGGRLDYVADRPV